MANQAVLGAEARPSELNPEFRRRRCKGALFRPMLGRLTVIVVGRA